MSRATSVDSDAIVSVILRSTGMSRSCSSGSSAAATHSFTNTTNVAELKSAQMRSSMIVRRLAGSSGKSSASSRELGDPALGQPLDRGAQEIGATGEVMRLRARGDAGQLVDAARRRRSQPDVGEAVDGGVEQLGARLGPALFLGAWHGRQGRQVDKTKQALYMFPAVNFEEADACGHS